MVIQKFVAVLRGGGAYDGHRFLAEPSEVMKGVWSAPYIMHMKLPNGSEVIEREYDPKNNGSLLYEKYGAPEIEDGIRIYCFKYNGKLIVK